MVERRFRVWQKPKRREGAGKARVKIGEEPKSYIKKIKENYLYNDMGQQIMGRIKCFNNFYSIKSVIFSMFSCNAEIKKLMKKAANTKTNQQKVWIYNPFKQI